MQFGIARTTAKKYIQKDMVKIHNRSIKTEY